ncbi:MAG: sugar ABC transporter permease, partial [Pseudomonadota bacterium]
MSDASPPLGPPTGTGPLQKREARLAWSLLMPTITIVSLVVILPLLAIFWISFKPIGLADLRPVAPVVREDLRNAGEPDQAVRYRLQNRSQDTPIENVTFTDSLPAGATLDVSQLPEQCVLNGAALRCVIGTLDPGDRLTFVIPIAFDGQDGFDDAALDAMEDALEDDTEAVATGDAESILTNTDFTLENFARIFDGEEFWTVMWATIFYTVFGTVGALVFGLFAALLLNKSFRGQGILRGLYLFPYVAPVIAVAFTWVNLFDPFSGSANALLVQMGVTEETINFFGQRPLALIMVTVFEIWRYFPLSFLFILARMQSNDTDMYEAADMDGASPFQKFWYLSLPVLLG